MKKYVLGEIGSCRNCSAPIEIKDYMLRKGNYVCVPCKNAWAKTERGRVTMSRAIRAWHVRNRDRAAISHRAFNERNPHQQRAKYDVRNAIRRGDLFRAPCVICGNPKSHGHHDNYDRPLDVVWLCQPHHVERHLSLGSYTRKPA
jgi:hypothetical protein